MKNGTCWLDDQGNLIQAHGGMIARFGDTWYWYGENKDADNTVVNGQVQRRIDVVGMSCYSSRDLLHWRHEGVVLPAVAQEGHPLHPKGVMERPKVIYSEKTGKYVMWFHLDRADYTWAAAGCAVADRPQGPFTFLHAVVPNRRDCRDMTIYRDPTDGQNYLVHSGDWNRTLYFSQLTEDCTQFTGVCYAQLPLQSREAPALCYHDGLHYCVTSGCTGWDPNSALYAVAPRLCGIMALIDNPCEGPNYRRTFEGQSTYIFEAAGRFYLMLDHWKRYDLRHSGYSILPIDFSQGRMTIPWQEEFNGIE